MGRKSQTPTEEAAAAEAARIAGYMEEAQANAAAAAALADDQADTDEASDD